MRYKEIKTPIQLDEVTMSPSNLRSEAKKIGATAGMEFEMIVPDTQSPSDDDREEDMDYDERTRSFRNVEQFFLAGDDNSQRSVDRFIETLRESYYEWAYEYVSDRFYSRDGRQYFNDYIEDQFDEDSARQKAQEEIQEENPDLEVGGDEFTDLVDQKISELKEEWLEEEWDDQGSLFEEARERFEQEEMENLDEDDWFDGMGYRYMSDLPYSDSDVYWPHWTDGESETDAGQAAASFEEAIGRKVNVSSSYHGERNDGEYTVEPDGSLDPDSDDDAGLEFVSPPLPLDQMLMDLNKTVAWAKKYGCYTNDSTGLHMNVSVPNFSRDKLDFVKLALLLGDEYVLKQFGRLTNTYTSSAFRKVKSAIENNPEKAANALQTMKSTLAREAAQLIHNGTTNKYTSINTKSGYIEFRSPGGDWLNTDIAQLENTLLRFVVALDAACDPEKYKQEYLKKFYKLLEPSTDEYGTMIKDFSDYVTGVGGAPESVVKSFRRSTLANLQRSNAAKRAASTTAQDANDQDSDGIKWQVVNAAGSPIVSFNARTQAGAEEMGRRFLLNLNPVINTSEFRIVRAQS